jgi:hypothetical protein
MGGDVFFILMGAITRVARKSGHRFSDPATRHY